MIQFISSLSSFVWGPVLMILLVGTGLFLTWRFRFLQIRGFRHAIHVLSGKFDRTSDPGEISHFRALSTALSATIGTGNIVGVAAAILTGGPGAVFWMWVTACVGMATKFASCTLAVHFRKIDDKGDAHAGPMHFIEIGMGQKFKWLAVLFAVFTAGASLGIGNMFQVNNIVSSVSALVLDDGAAAGSGLKWLTASIVAVVCAMVILGGIKRIALVASRLVPLMCLLYVLAGIIILIKNYTLIPHGFGLIFQYAFNAPEAVTGGIVGGVIRAGVARGLFSNEAGLGSAAMAHGAAKTDQPVREGLVAMLGPLIDTIIVCTITALVIICTGAHEVVSHKGQLTIAAFETGLPGSGWVVSLGILLFAFSTLIAWSYYGDRAVDYLFGGKFVKVYRLLYIAVIFLGALNPLDLVINICDILNALMALPNLIAVLALSPVVLKLLKDYRNTFMQE